MRLSTKSEYACLALVDMAEHYDEGPVRIADIAARREIPKKFLEQILLSLKQAGYLHSQMGPHGGYRLARPPEKISLAEVVRLMDGPVAPVHSASKYFYHSTPIEKHKPLLAVFRDIRDYAARKLETTSFADLIGRTTRHK